jgi:hypothetical protein
MFSPSVYSSGCQLRLSAVFRTPTTPGIPRLIIRLSENLHTRPIHHDDSVYALRRTYLDRVHLARHPASVLSRR